METRRAVVYLPQGTDALPVVGERGPRFDVVQIVRGGSPDEPESGALGEALRRLAQDGASVLLVARLADAASSAGELIALIDWLAAARADLVALDVRLDTASAAGRRTTATLREVARWRRGPAPGRPPRGRPGLAALAPELSARIAALRAQGSSMQAIADALNADGVPTQRGGARWRPSSVQAALGYRRPAPRPPGAPPPPGAQPPPPRGHAADPPPPGRPAGRHADPPPAGRPVSRPADRPPPPRRRGSR